MKRVFMCVSVAIGFLLLPVAAWAQLSGTASIVGTVRDTSGGVLPGVTVEAASPALIEKLRTTVTDSDGLYRFVDLRPGDYTVTFTLAGFSTFKRDGIVLPANFTATVNADMTIGALSETITVTGEAPLVDTQNTRQQTQFEQATLQALPGTGRAGGIAQLVPGATLGSVTRYSVGGVNDAGQFDYSVHGVPTAEPVVNGMTQMVGAMTLGVFVFNQATFQELVVETSGVGADRETGGMQVNIIQKDGGNMFSGMGNYTYSGPNLESDNIDDALKARHASQVGGLKRYYDAAFALGGPIKRDRVWFFGATRAGNSQQNQQGNFYNKRQGTVFYEADQSRPAATLQRTKDYTLRLTWQATQNQKFVASSSWQPNTNGLFNLLAPGVTLAAPEAAAWHDYMPQGNTNFSWRFPANNHVLLEADLALLRVAVETKPVPGTGTDIQVIDVGRNLRYGSRGQNLGVTGSYIYVNRTDDRASFAMSYVTGRHNFKTGVMGRWFHTGDPTHNTNINQIMGSTTYTFRNQVPSNVTIWAAPYAWVEDGNDIALYAQDQWTVGKATLNLGLRYNDTSTTLPETHLAAGLFVPARTLPEVKGEPHWRNLNPRVGLAYDLFGTGRTAIKLALGRYNPILRSTAQAPAAVTITPSTGRTWNDRIPGNPGANNYVPDCNLLDPNPNGECGVWSDFTFGQNVVPSRNADDAKAGFNQQDYYWQGSASVQHEISPKMAVNVGYFRTWYGNYLATQNVALDPRTDFDQYCFIAPTDGRLPSDISGQRLCGLYDVKPEKVRVRRSNVVTQVSHFGSHTKVYNGADVNVNARLGRFGQYSGGISVGRTTEENCAIVNSPMDARWVATTAGAVPAYCATTPPWGAGTQVKLTAIYPLPWSLQASIIYQNFAGIPNNPTITLTNAQVFESLGRNLAACPATATTPAACTQTVTVELAPTGTMYEPRVQQVDFKLTGLLRVDRYRIKGMLDVGNLFNTGDVLQLQRLWGATYLDAQQVMGGRLLKFGVQVDF